jgi:lysozyme family protein
MKSNFERCLAEVLGHEGGWSDHPADPGGATMKGVTIGTFAQFKGRKVEKDELRKISDADLRAIYRRKYWDVVRGDDLPAGLDLVAFDAAVNSGPARGARWLQEALGVTADGKVGPVTVMAARSANAEMVVIRACDLRMLFLRRLKTWPDFGKGWSRRVESVRRVALEMALVDHKPAKTAPQAPGQAPHDPADNARILGRTLVAALALAGVTVAAWLADLGAAVRDFLIFWQ